MSAPFRATDEIGSALDVRSALSAISFHNSSIMGAIEDIERAAKSGAVLNETDIARLGDALDFTTANARKLSALLSGDFSSVRLADIAFLQRFVPTAARRAAE
ncbi:hypothetical protein [Methylobacterium sp. yr596]|uniref:hypothetical protein n=1 Tax=Methylobacterium sp. yr596 TaxID=1761800 RepID=UPI0008EF9EF0|nr:hypothetical protein [Methylobacterium sp. yr596]SFF90159.1 hypothetical protein SAMN04487844_1773 [Methylobacterium sp. yr596]